MDKPDTDFSTYKYRISSIGLLMMSLVSLGIYTGLTWLIVSYFQEASLASVFTNGLAIPLQLLIGLLFGLFAAAAISYVMFRTSFSFILRDYALVDMLADMKFSRFDRLQISFFAGTGEELLFRGALQPILGIGLTSVLFVGIHGYFKFTSLRHILFGVIMFSLSAGLGLLYHWIGLVSAMVAHAVYDHVMLEVGQRYAFGQKYGDETGR